MSENKPLPGWPTTIRYKPNPKGGMLVEAPFGLYEVIAYERALKEAYAARLRKLHKAATRFMATDLAKKHADYGCVDAIAEALEAVGDLPDEGAG